MQFSIRFSAFLIVSHLIVPSGHCLAAPVSHEVILEEVWRTDPEEPPFYRSLADFVVIGDELFVLDKRAFIISVYACSDGRYLRDLDIQGEGPGELTSVVSMEAFSEDTLGVFSPFGPSLVFVDRTNGGPSYEFGQSRVTFSCEGERDFVHAYRCEYKDGNLYYSGKDLSAAELFLTRADVLSEHREMNFLSVPAHSRFLGESPVIDESDSYFMSSEGWCIGDSGRVYVSEKRCGHGQLEVAVYRDDHKAGVIHYPYESRKRSKAEKDAIKQNELGGERGLRRFAALGGTIQVDDYDPDILEMMEYEGCLWVRTSRCDERPDSRSYAVFSPEGSYLGHRTVIMDGVNLHRDRVVFLGERVVIVKGLEEESPLHFIVATMGEAREMDH